MSRQSPITFDVDGTLYDSSRQRWRFLPIALRHPRIITTWEREKQRLRGERVADFEEVLNERVAEALGISVERVAEVIDRLIHKEWIASFDEKSPTKGLRRLLSALDEGGYTRAILSDHAAEEKLRRMGLEEGWAVKVDCSALGALKPDPAGLIAAAEALGVEPSSVIHVGDRDDTDGEMARAVGARALIKGRDWRDMEELGRLLIQGG